MLIEQGIRASSRALHCTELGLGLGLGEFDHSHKIQTGVQSGQAAARGRSAAASEKTPLEKSHRAKASKGGVTNKRRKGGGSFL
jgi:hypothetical protein